MVRWSYTGNGFWELEVDGKRILKAYAYGESADDRRVDSRTAELTLNAWDMENSRMILRLSGDEGLSLIEHLSISPSGRPLADCELRSVNMQETVATRLLDPLVLSVPDAERGALGSDRRQGHNAQR